MRFYKNFEQKIKSFTKVSIISGFLVIFILHMYTAIRLASTDAMNENIPISLSFDLLFSFSIFLLWIFAGKGQYGRILEWFSYFAPLLYIIWDWTWKNEQFDFLGGFGAYFPINSTLLVITMIFYLISALYLILLPLKALIKGLMRYRKQKDFSYFKRAFSKKFLSKKAFLLILPAVMIALAFPMPHIVQNEGNEKTYIRIEDKNKECTFAVWNFVKFDAQIGDTQEIDLNLLNADQKRIMTAFGEMNTTFFGQIHFDTEKKANHTIAFMKMLDAYNCSACATIWYDNVEEYNFPGPAYPNNWISNARHVLEFVVANEIPNVEGICMDSESQAEFPPDIYWENVEIYDEFLKEVQMNESLANPNPQKDTFETVLCFTALSALDAVDGDMDLVYGSRHLGLPPSSWTQYHFMQYRMHPSMTPTEMYSYNILSKKYLVVDKVTPITGLAAVQWFAEGYFNGTAPDLGFEDPESTYDGVDGFEALKREIFLCKAMGFHQVNMFKLYSYGPSDPPVVEDYGFLEDYGIEALETLAEEWNKEKTVEYPIYGSDFKLSRGGFYQPFGNFRHDLWVNTEMYVVRWLAVIAVLIVVFYSSKK